MQACESSDGITDTDVCLQSPSNVLDVGSTHLFPVLSEPGLSFTFENNDSSSGCETKERPPSATQQRTTPPAAKPRPKLHEMKTKYKSKYERLKRHIKDTVFLNAALRDDVSCTEADLAKAKQERKFLLKKVFQYLPMTETQAVQSAAALKSIAGSFEGKFPPSILDPASNSGTRTVPHSPKRRKKAVPKGPPDSESDSAHTTQGAASSDSSRPKRRKPGTAINRKVNQIARDGDGEPVFPIVLGSLVVHSLGKIVHAKPGFHSERYLWPIGFCSSRTYFSMINPDSKVRYVCSIVDNDTAPLFQIVADDDKANPISAATATACHCAVLKRLNRARGKDATNTGSGPEFFGFSHPTIQYLLQCLPNAKLCWKYNWVQFKLPTAGTGTGLSNLSYGSATDNEVSPTPPARERLPTQSDKHEQPA